MRSKTAISKIGKLQQNLADDVVAGTGFEPRDLRVMSPTSYQTAPPRDIVSFEQKLL